MSYGYIYLIQDHFNNKVYVGQHNGKNPNYMGSGIIISRIFQKYPYHLSKIILGYCNSKKELNEAEKICIEFFDAQNPIYGYNLTKGGDGGAILGHITKEETKKKISTKLKGRIITQESKQKISKTLKGNIPWNKGKTYSKELKSKLSLVHKGKKHSLETKLKISQAKLGKNNPMHRKTIYQIWIDKYGIEEAKKREQIRKDKISKNSKRKNQYL